MQNTEEGSEEVESEIVEEEEEVMEDVEEVMEGEAPLVCNPVGPLVQDAATNTDPVVVLNQGDLRAIIQQTVAETLSQLNGYFYF